MSLPASLISSPLEGRVPTVPVPMLAKSQGGQPRGNATRPSGRETHILPSSSRRVPLVPFSTKYCDREDNQSSSASALTWAHPSPLRHRLTPSLQPESVEHQSAQRLNWLITQAFLFPDAYFSQVLCFLACGLRHCTSHPNQSRSAPAPGPGLAAPPTTPPPV